MQPVLLDGPQAINLPYQYGAGPIATADFNADGDIDLAVYNQGWLIFLNNRGSLSYKTKIGDYGGPHIADFNNDGHVDFATFGNLHLGNGDGTFILADAPFSISAAGDVNGDGHIDILHLSEGQMVLSTNTGFGTYVFAAQLPAGESHVGKFLGNNRDDIAIADGYTLKLLSWNGKSFDITTNTLPVAAIRKIEPISINSDPRKDLVVTETNLQKLFSSNGDGTFQLVATFAVEAGAVLHLPMAAGDFNGDDHIDWVTHDYPEFSIRYGSAFNVWDEPKKHFGDYGSWFAAADLDGDTKSDLVTAGTWGQSYPKLELLLSSKNHLARLLPVFQPYPLACGDFKRDGRLDLLGLVFNLPNVPVGLGTLFADSSGSFHLSHLQIRKPITYASSGDLNRDGFLDIVVPSSRGYAALLGTGTGSFKSAGTVLKVPEVWETALADFNGDGKLDLLVSTNGITLLSPGKGNGYFSSNLLFIASDGGANATACDWNDDGKADFVCMTTNRNDIRVYRGHGNGTFSLAYSSTFGATNATSWAHFDFADFNRDGLLDIVVASRFIKILFQTQSGAFTAFNAHATTYLPYRVSAGDFNGDGNPDLTYSRSWGQNPETTILLGTGNGTFELQMLNDVLNSPADYNGDGKPDFLSSTAIHHNITPFRKRTDLIWQDSTGAVHSWFFRGTNFADVEHVKDGKAVASEWHAAGFGDFNGDGERDLVWRHKDGRITSWILRGTQVRRTKNIRTGPAQDTGWRIVAVDDFNKDHQCDFLWQNSSGQLLAWLMNGTNITSTTWLRDRKPVTGRRLVATADFDDDGDPDFLWQNHQNVLSLWIMDGLKTVDYVELREGAALTTGWKAVAAQDLNEDNSPDILFHHTNGKVAVWYMNGTTFESAQILRNNIAAPKGWRAIGAK